MSGGIAYLDGPRPARSLFATADWVAAGREEINRVNAFPVPDGDTGTNFGRTLRDAAAAAECAATATNGSSPASVPSPAALFEVAAEREFRFCTEVLVRGEQLPAANEVAVAGDTLEIHVHTDTPEAVFSYATRWGLVEATKADDMLATGVLGTHVGAGAWAIFYQAED